MGSKEVVRVKEGTALTVSGICDPSFSALRDALIANFSNRDEIGAAVAVYLDGNKVVDLWGGWRDEARSRPWQENTLCSIYSISKSMCALCVHILIDRGRIDLEAPVALHSLAAENANAIELTVVGEHGIDASEIACRRERGMAGGSRRHDGRRMALGFIKNTPPGMPMGPNPAAFGHYGSNGALAFADGERKLAFACTTNFVTDGAGVGDRTSALVKAIDASG